MRRKRTKLTKIKEKEAQKAELKCSELKIETTRTCSINKGTGESNMEAKRLL